MQYELKVHSFWQTIGKGFNLYFDNFIVLVLVSLVLKLPYFYYINQSGSYVSMDEDFMAFFIDFSWVHFLSFTIYTTLSAFVVIVVSGKYFGEEVGFTDQLRYFILIFLPILGLSLILTFLSYIALLLLIVPLFFFMVRLSIAMPIFVLERKTMTESIKRSWELTKGYKWLIFGFIMVPGIIEVLIVQSVSYLIDLSFNPKSTDLIKAVLSSITDPLSLCVIVVVYYNILIKKEGFNIEHLANQFDLEAEDEYRL